jgi:hypothetical protein
MSLFADILDRLSGVTSLKEKIAAQGKVLGKHRFISRFCQPISN